MQSFIEINLVCAAVAQVARLSHEAAMIGRLFSDHPRSLGMSWVGHGVGALGIGARMVGAGLACVVHAVVPALFTETAGRTVAQLSEQMKARKAGKPDWPDFEI